MTKNLLLPGQLPRIIPIRTEIGRLLFLSVCFSILLLGVRIVSTHSLTSASLAWNLFLAWIPFGISGWLYSHTSFIKNKWIFAVFFTVWLLFIPNAFYIITDLFHLHDNRNAPLWFDLLLIFSFAWNGLLMGILSIRQMEKISGIFFPFKQEITFLYPVMWLNALGIYIGRYLRYNTWDVITSPFSLTANMLHLLLHPVLCKNEWAMVFSFSVFMTLVYMTVKRISRMAW